MDESFVLEHLFRVLIAKKKTPIDMAICNWNPAKCFLSSFYLFINIPVLYYKALGPSRGTKRRFTEPQ